MITAGSPPIKPRSVYLRRMTHLAASRRVRLAVCAAALGLFALALTAPLIDGRRIRTSDDGAYLSIAVNLVRHGEFHNSERLAEERAAAAAGTYIRRAPAFPFYLAAIFAAVPGNQSLSADCLDDRRCAAADPFRRRVQQVTTGLKVATVVGTLLAAHALGAGLPFSTAAGLMCLMLLTRDTPSVLAAFLLLGHAVLAATAWRRPRAVTGALSGLCLGLLALTKTIFQYWFWGFALVWLAAMWWSPGGENASGRAGRRRSLTTAFAALFAAAWIVVLPWMIRNAALAGHFGISGRGGHVLGERAEFDQMTWSEVRGAFAYYLPDEASHRNPHGIPVRGQAGPIRGFLMERLEPETFGYDRFDRDNPDGFFMRAKDARSSVRVRADRIDPQWRRDPAREESVLRRAAVEIIRENLLKHLTLTLVFAERGSAFWGDAHRRRVYAGRLHRVLRSTAVKVGYLLFPTLGCMLVLAWKRRDAALAFLLLPIVYSFAIHATATHFIPRYSYPLVPLIAVTFALAGREAWRWTGNERPRRRPA